MPSLFSSPPLCYSSLAPLFHARCCWSWLLQFPAPPHCCHTTDLHTDPLQWLFFFLVYVLPEWKIYELRDEILEGKKIQVGSFQSWEHWKVELAHAHAHTPQAVCPPSIIRVNTVELAFKWWSLWTIFLSSVLYHSAFSSVFTASQPLEFWLLCCLCSCIIHVIREPASRLGEKKAITLNLND